MPTPSLTDAVRHEFLVRSRVTENAEQAVPLTLPEDLSLR